MAEDADEVEVEVERLSFMVMAVSEFSFRSIKISPI